MRNIKLLYGICILVLFSCSKEKVLEQDYIAITQVNDVCFSPEKDIHQYIIKKILSTKDSLDLMIFKFDNKEIADAVIQITSENKKVRVLIDIRSVFNMTDINNINYNYSVIDYLYCNGVDLKIYDIEPYILHQKVLLIDKKEIIIGSANYYTKDLVHNYEFNLSFFDTLHFSKFKQDFETLWNSSKSYKYEKLCSEKKRKGLKFDLNNDWKIDTSQARQFTIGNVTINNVLLSKDKGVFEDFIISNIRKAKDSILIQASILSSKRIINELIEESLQGVIIKIIANGLDQNSFSKLQNSNIHLKLYDTQNKEGMMHSKIILIDNHIVICGSVNMFERSLYHDVENLLKFDSKEMYSVFYKNWILNWCNDDFI
jgi:phosphatidylserine/phosphatidylglycerophosphate/cardiolipin synthase-like enzyme